MRRMKSLALIATAALFLFVTSCEKTEVDEPNAVSQTTTTVQNKSASNPTLQEFIASMETPEEIAFFDTHGITDNTGIVDDAFNSGSPMLAKPKVTFTWAGKGSTGHGCKKPLGICIVFAAPTDPNVDLMVHGNKYIIVYEAGQTDTGLTSDGYMPIYEDVYVDPDITIKAGIYKANVSASGTYTAVGIDIL